MTQYTPEQAREFADDMGSFPFMDADEVIRSLADQVEELQALSHPKSIEADSDVMKVAGIAPVALTPGASEWLPIETAPKDGTEIGVISDEEPGIIRRVRWAHHMGNSHLPMCWVTVNKSLAITRLPKHWISLPPNAQAAPVAQLSEPQWSERFDESMLEDAARSAYESANAYGYSLDAFMRLAREVHKRTSIAAAPTTPRVAS